MVPKKLCFPATNWGLSMVSFSQLQVAQLSKIVVSVGPSVSPSDPLLMIPIPQCSDTDPWWPIAEPRWSTKISLKPIILFLRHFMSLLKKGRKKVSQTSSSSLIHNFSVFVILHEVEQLPPQFFMEVHAGISVCCGLTCLSSWFLVTLEAIFC